MQVSCFGKQKRSVVHETAFFLSCFVEGDICPKSESKFASAFLLYIAFSSSQKILLRNLFREPYKDKSSHFATRFA